MSNLDLYSLIRRPLITEKSTLQKDKQNQLTFEVDRKTNKIEIKHAVEKLFKVHAVEKLFKVKVLNVNTISVSGKVKRVGKHSGKRRDWRKAIVTLKKGDHIDFFEGA